MPVISGKGCRGRNYFEHIPTRDFTAPDLREDSRSPEGPNNFLLHLLSVM